MRVKGWCGRADWKSPRRTTHTEGGDFIYYVSTSLCLPRPQHKYNIQYCLGGSVTPWMSLGGAEMRPYIAAFPEPLNKECSAVPKYRASRTRSWKHGRKRQQVARHNTKENGQRDTPTHRTSPFPANSLTLSVRQTSSLERRGIRFAPVRSHSQSGCGCLARPVPNIIGH